MGSGWIPLSELSLGKVSRRNRLLCEYDALPEIGHACGHNLIGTASVGAAVAWRSLWGSCRTKLVVLGAPRKRRAAAK